MIMFGPIFLTVALIGFIYVIIISRTSIFTSFIQGGRTWTRGSSEARSRVLAFTILFVLMIMGVALIVEALVELVPPKLVGF